MTKKPTKWIPLAGGSFNEVYINAEEALVFKVVHNKDYGTDTPERSVRLWNLLNPNLKPKAKLQTIAIDGVSVNGWTCPYIQSKHSLALSNESESTTPDQDKKAYRGAMTDPTIRDQEDKNISKALIDIYNRTGRIIVDAGVPGNFMVTKQNAVVCVDIGMALLLEQSENTCLNEYARRDSIVSNNTWGDVHQEISNTILQNDKAFFPKTVSMTKALLFLRSVRPDIHNVDFLTENHSHITQLAKAYDANESADVGIGLALLEQEQPVNLSSIKKSCEKILMEYVQSRGSLDENKTFRASGITTYFRNSLLTKHKVHQAQMFMKEINSAHSIEDIQNIFQKASQDSALSKGINSKFGTCLGLCKLISQIPPTPEPTHIEVNSI